MRLRFTRPGREDFSAAIAYIKRDNPGAADRFRRHAEQALARLELFPESGRFVPELRGARYREVIVRPYRFVYVVEGETVWIAAVWHGAQRPVVPEE